MHIYPDQVTFGRPRLKTSSAYILFLKSESLLLVIVVQRYMIKLIFSTWSIKNDPSNYGGEYGFEHILSVTVPKSMRQLFHICHLP